MQLCDSIAILYCCSALRAAHVHNEYVPVHWVYTCTLELVYNVKDAIKLVNVLKG